MEILDGPYIPGAQARCQALLHRLLHRRTVPQPPGARGVDAAAAATLVAPTTCLDYDLAWCDERRAAALEGSPRADAIRYVTNQQEALQRIEPWVYLRDLFCLLPSWAITQVLALAPVSWTATLQRETVQATLAANIFRRATLLEHQRAVA